MATQSLVSLKLETAEYESKIKRAQQGLLAMEKECRSVNGILINLDKSQLDYVRSLGQMETKSQTAKGKVAELSSAFTELRAMYNRLSEEEKQGDFGKALINSLDQLKGRIKEGQAELKNINGEISNNGSLLDQLSSKFGVSIKQLTGWGIALGAAKGALEVTKDAFFASETNIDAWARTQYTAQSAYEAFLTSLNTGDISGYLSNIDSIVNAARQAYDELDRLSTQKAINNAAVKRQESENERLRAMLRTGRYIAPNDGRSTGGMKTGDKLSQDQLTRISKMLANGQVTLNKYIRDEIKQTTKSINALYKEQSLRLGMSEKEFRAGTMNMDAFDERIAGYKKYKEYEGKRNNILARANSGHNISDSDAALLRGKNPYERYKAWGVFKDDGELFSKINELINQRETLASQDYGNTAKIYRSINKVENTKTTSPKTPKATTPKPTPEMVSLGLLGIQQGVATPERTSYEYAPMTANGINGFISSLQKQMQNADLGSFLYKSLEYNLVDATSFKELFTTAMQEGIDFASLNVDPKELWENVASGKAVPDEVWENLAQTISDKMGGDGITFDASTGKVGKGKGKKDKKDPLEQISKGLSGVSQTLAGIQQIGIEIPQDIQNVISFGQGLLQAIQGVTTVIGLFSSGAEAANTAAVTANTVAIGGLITAIYANTFKSFLPFMAHGGIARAANGMVGGNHFSGDNLPVLVNSGEVILNKAQTGNLASQLQAGGQQVQMQPWLQGETIYLGMNNALNRMGKGEIVTTSMLKKMK